MGGPQEQGQVFRDESTKTILDLPKSIPYCFETIPHHIFLESAYTAVYSAEVAPSSEGHAAGIRDSQRGRISCERCANPTAYRNLLGHSLSAAVGQAKGLAAVCRQCVGEAMCHAIYTTQ